MDTFHWITATIGMVMALGMTRLLASGVTLFRSRKRVAMDWVAIVWALSIFYSMLNFSWDLRHPSGVVAEWSFVRCLILLGFALTLFVAAALILPQEELPAGSSLRDEFAQDGRWALIFIAAYDLLCIAFNWFYWHVPPVSVVGALNVILSGLALTALKSPSPKLEGVATVLYAVIIFGTAFLMDS